MEWDDLEDIGEARRIIRTLHSDLRFEWKFNRCLMMIIIVLALVIFIGGLR